MWGSNAVTYISNGSSHFMFHITVYPVTSWRYPGNELGYTQNPYRPRCVPAFRWLTSSIYHLPVQAVHLYLRIYARHLRFLITVRLRMAERRTRWCISTTAIKATYRHSPTTQSALLLEPPGRSCDRCYQLLPIYALCLPGPRQALPLRLRHLS